MIDMKHTDNSNVAEFAEACVDTNSMNELLEAIDQFLVEDADLVDCREWEITESQWYDAIEAATAEKVRIWAIYNECSELIEAIADWSNTDSEDVEIDGDGDIHDGLKWLDNEKLIELYRWHRSIYGE